MHGLSYGAAPPPLACRVRPQIGGIDAARAREVDVQSRRPPGKIGTARPRDAQRQVVGVQRLGTHATGERSNVRRVGIEWVIEGAL
jgi:hypothetical protein